jgi:hypothetical protein
MAAGLPVDSIVWVPSKGAAPAIVELLGGHVDAVCCSVPEALSQIESGELRALAVMSPQRLPEFPNIPTCKELGVQWEAVGWRGLALPKDTPTNVVATLVKACVEITQSDPFKTFMKKNGFAPQVRGPAEFGAFLAEQDEQWHKVILGANIGAESISAATGAAVSYDPGPWAMPIAVSGFIAIGLGYQFLRRKPAIKPSSGASARLISAVGAMTIYLLAMPLIGFFATSSVLTIGTIRWMGRRWSAAIISTMVLMVVIYLLFVRLFRVPLPAGVLF